MNEAEHNGRAVAWISKDDDRWLVEAKNGTTLTARYYFHGDHDSWWIVEAKNGIEVARHNAMQLGTITWLPHSASGKQSK